MLQWKDIDTVLLDMDGTLLDLHFDNHFWLELVPKRYAKMHGLSEQAAVDLLNIKLAAQAGQLNWYCLDYWQKELSLDLVEMKREIAHLIKMRTDVPAFLTALKQANKRIILLTNAHPDSLSLKIEKTQLDDYIDEFVSTHQYGVSKESLSLWQQIEVDLKFDKQRCLFIDDSLAILAKAKVFGIAEVIAVANPDSQKPARKIAGFNAIIDYHSLTQALINDTQ